MATRAPRETHAPNERPPSARRTRKVTSKETPSAKSPELRRDHLRDVLDGLREGMQILSREWRYLYVNEAVARHGRRSREELLGRTIFECYPGFEHTLSFEALNRCMLSRQAETVETDFEYPDGDHAFFELRIQPCPEGLLVLSLDISEKRRLENNLRESERLRALGQITAGVSHDLRNVLNPLVLQLEVLKRRLRGGTDPESLGIVNQMISVVRGGCELLDQMRDLGRHTPQPTAPVALDEVARNAAALCRLRVRESAVTISVVEALDARSRVCVSESELLAAIVNLLFNAVDALPDGGNITLHTFESDERVCLEVEDDGVGMPPEVEARCMEPFFTTKGEAGVGLGLASVFALASRHGGNLSVRTGVGRGTAIRLMLPRAERTVSSVL